mmetsp:Transcript_49689/g.131719  ORF Transcript_49689/g.131719 Transcript_49689/m.131719 type:complete len:207 (+) Transcript_49689:446-1066(+)
MCRRCKAIEENERDHSQPKEPEEEPSVHPVRYIQKSYDNSEYRATDDKNKPQNRGLRLIQVRVIQDHPIDGGYGESQTLQDPTCTSNEEEPHVCQHLRCRIGQTSTHSTVQHVISTLRFSDGSRKEEKETRQRQGNDKSLYQHESLHGLNGVSQDRHQEGTKTPSRIGYLHSDAPSHPVLWSRKPTIGNVSESSHHHRHAHAQQET